MIYDRLECYRGFPTPLAYPFSGGRSSGYQLAHVIKANNGLPEGCAVHFCNTGFEREETLDFVRDFAEYFAIPVTWLEWDIDAPNKVRVVDHATASRQGEPLRKLFSYTVPKRRDGSAGLRPLPGPYKNGRICTSELKIKTAHRYYTKVLGWQRYWSAPGFRADEPNRVKKATARAAGLEGSRVHPAGGIEFCMMAEAGVDSDTVQAFWAGMPFDLKMASWQGNCDMCFMKTAWKIKAAMKENPERAQLWIDLEEMPRDRRNRFRTDRPSMRELFAQVQAGDMGHVKERAMDGCTSCFG
jgi:hypothetical protein